MIEEVMNQIHIQIRENEETPLSPLNESIITDIVSVALEESYNEGYKDADKDRWGWE